MLSPGKCHEWIIRHARLWSRAANLIMTVVVIIIIIVIIVIIVIVIIIICKLYSRKDFISNYLIGFSLAIRFSRDSYMLTVNDEKTLLNTCCISG